jgi:hypothetical protein
MVAIKSRGYINIKIEPIWVMNDCSLANSLDKDHEFGI